jgi:hypothetical protein
MGDLVGREPPGGNGCSGAHGRGRYWVDGSDRPRNREEFAVLAHLDDRTAGGPTADGTSLLDKLV